MDLRAVKSAPRAELAACAVAAARNARDLLRDAGMLAAAASNGRAYSLAVLSVEETGKGMDLTALAAMPGSLRARAPLRDLLERHAIKLVGGLLLSVLPFSSVASRITAMPDEELQSLLRYLAAIADVTDSLKRRGIYVDLERDGIHCPDEVTGPEAADQLGIAFRAVKSIANVLLTPEYKAWLEDPPRDGIELAEELVNALIETDGTRTPQQAIGVLTNAVAKFRASRRDLLRATATSPESRADETYLNQSVLTIPNTEYRCKHRRDRSRGSSAHLRLHAHDPYRCAARQTVTGKLWRERAPDGSSDPATARLPVGRCPARICSFEPRLGRAHLERQHDLEDATSDAEQAILCGACFVQSLSGCRNPYSATGSDSRHQITFGHRDRRADCGGWDTDAVPGLTLPPGSPVQVFTAEEQPDLWVQANDGFAGSWPEYNMHGNHAAAYSASWSGGPPGSRCWSTTAPRTEWSAGAGLSRCAGTARALTCRRASTRPGCAL
jgi:AbiV family abortive infection protein